MNPFTQIYLVTNCFGDPNKVYVGKEKSHQKYSREKSHKNTFGENVIFTFIDKCNGWNSKQWLPLEYFWIEQFRQWGFELQNKNKGGGGVSFHTEESKQKLRIPKPKGFGEMISKISKLHPIKFNDETKHKISVAKTNHPCYKDPERNRKISEANIGRKCSEETKLKMSKSNKGLNKGKIHTYESKQKVSLSNLGKKRTQETKDKISKSKKGTKHKPETILKFKNRKRSELSKQKQSNTLKGRKITWNLGTKGKPLSQEQKDKIGNKTSKKVLQYKDDILVGEFKSYTEAKKITKIDSQNVLSGKSKLAGGFYWKYDLTQKQEQNLRNSIKLS